MLVRLMFCKTDYYKQKEDNKNFQSKEKKIKGLLRSFKIKYKR